ncbi:MAG TPA: hypothetical protein VIV60_34595 [Polyangiaceae bacterium]
MTKWIAIATAVASQVLLISGCTDEDSASKKDSANELLAPPKQGEGVQLRMVSALSTGVETERCMFYQVGSEGLAINREEVRFTPGSHHVLLYTTPYETIPQTDRFGNDVDTSGVFECGPKGPTAHWQVNGVAGGAQIANGPPIVDDLPPGVAFNVAPGTVLLMNTHYLNATDETLQTDARINLYTLKPSEVTAEAGILFWYNPIIYVPSQKNSSAREVCPIRKDIHLVNAQSHMHKRGVGYVAQKLDAAGAAIDDLYDTTEWEEVTLRKFEPADTLTAGQSVDFQCNYTNNTDHTIIQGLSTADEMCMFIGLYYPRDRQTELCGLNGEWSGAFWSATWIGEGTADGATTAACLNGSNDKSVDAGASFYRCVIDSCPAIGTATSAAARCLATNGLGACSTQCSSDVAACRACISEQCAAAMTALSAAQCS